MRLAIRTVLAAAALLASTRCLPAHDMRQPARKPVRAAFQVPPQNPMPAIHADNWAEAEDIATRFADPVTRKLVLYFRLLAPGAATPGEIAAFMQNSPDWPAQALLEQRRQEAIAVDPDDADVLAQCHHAMPTLGSALLRCAQAMANAGDDAGAAAAARHAWIDAISDPGTEAAFQQRWAGTVTPADQWQRFQRLAWRDTAAASRQIPRLDPANRAAATARLALKRDDPTADGLFLALPGADQREPGMVLDRARFLRHANRDSDAVAEWTGPGVAAQRAAPEHQATFWNERNLLVRQLLRDGDKDGAYAVAAEPGVTKGEAALDADFLAGYIALRVLNDPARATGHFKALAAASKAAITQGRAHYWLGRAAAAAGRDPRAEYAEAARWTTTFYGQLAAVAMGEDVATLNRRIEAERDPAWTREAALAFTQHEVVRAAAWLVAWGEPRRARAFLLRMDELAPIPAERVLTAVLGARVGLPDIAVFVARRIGRDGSALPKAGWPVPFDPPAGVDDAVALGIMRQESSFDVGAVSPSGARGLMQLMPPTATEVAKQLGVSPSIPALTTDPSYNMRLGSRYIEDMLAHFGEALPLAVAAYNAGPRRVDEWLAQNGDPRTDEATGAPPIGMIDWIERIPVNQTRNYVQRVLENIVIYRALRGETTPTLLPQWTQ
ncbi:MAG TPA: lytic transglycosylase domain-containing protein [Acetobacteraceae bacterium]|nr:lytic transglycosylase domain-containing protein [Acetobacteraceae bacterium]